MGGGLGMGGRRGLSGCDGGFIWMSMVEGVRFPWSGCRRGFFVLGWWSGCRAMRAGGDRWSLGGSGSDEGEMNRFPSACPDFGHQLRESSVDAVGPATWRVSGRAVLHAANLMTFDFSSVNRDDVSCP